MDKGNQGPPPPYGFQAPPPFQQQPMPQATVHTVVTGPGFQPVGPNSQNMVCPSCHHQIKTRVVTESTTKTHLMALLLCVFCCWPCICVPYCMDSCKNLNHYCPKCHAFLGSYNS